MSFSNPASAPLYGQGYAAGDVSMNNAWKGIVSDEKKLDGVVEAMTLCMSSVLSLRDPEVDCGKTPWGRTLYEEMEYSATAAQLDELERIARATAFVERAHGVALCLGKAANAQTNVLLTQYSRNEAFECAWDFSRSNPSAPGGRSKLKVGGLRRLLYVDILPQVQRWLLECDAAMMVTCHDTVSDNRGNERLVVELATDLAQRIANRLTLVPDKGDAPLSTESLQARCMKELAGLVTSTPGGQQELHRTDLEALKTMYLLALEGPKSVAGQQILAERLPHLQHIASSPPFELGIQGANAQHMNMRLFGRACAPALDPAVRTEMMHQWRELHGVCAATAIAQAIQKLKMQATPMQRDPTFCKVLFTPDEQAPLDASDMPRPLFVHSPHRWKLVGHPEQRAVYDWARRRCVRLSSLVLQLLGHGTLERGVVGSKIVEPIAMQAALTARVVGDILDEKRREYSLGTRLLLFCGNVRDCEGHLSAKVADALAHVSRFSIMELLAVFSRYSPAMKVILPDLTFRTRRRLGNCRSSPIVPSTYLTFVYDAMPFLLKSIENRRGQLGLHPCQASNPVCELLRAVPAARGWNPFDGTLRLSLEDLKDGPPMLPAMLKELSNRGLLVQYKRFYDPLTRKKSAKQTFVFDSAQLVAVLSGYALLGRAP